MSFHRTVTRTATAVLAAVGLSVAAAGAASATTATHNVKGNDVSVTFTRDGELWDNCVAGITPTSYAPTLASKFSSLKPTDIATVAQLASDPNITLLKTGGFPAAILTLISPSVTLSASGVKPNLYALVTFCTSTSTPGISTVTVGNPLEAASGSLQSFSADGNQAALSSMLGKAAGA